MIEPDLDEPLADRQRNQALRRLARNAELARDLVLSVAGDVIEPSGAGGLVEPQSVMIRLARHGFSPRPQRLLGPPARRRGQAAEPYRRRGVRRRPRSNALRHQEARNDWRRQTRTPPSRRRAQRRLPRRYPRSRGSLSPPRPSRAPQTG